MSHRYHNPDPAHRPHGPGAILRWSVTDRLRRRRRRAAPGPPAPTVVPDLRLIHRDSSQPRLTWIGHASWLGTLGNRHFLIDPLFSQRVGGLFRRHVAAALLPAQLPSLTAVLVTHNHYDHLDALAFQLLPRTVPVIVPEGLARWFRGRRAVTEVGWWDTVDVEGLRITLVPARHWSRRTLGDTNRSLWGGYVVESGDHRVYHSGDTAYFGGFAEIGRRFPKLDAAMLPVGTYEPPWFMEHHHLNPEDAGRAFLEIGARHFLPMHWGVLQLADEPLCEPADRVRTWWESTRPGDGRRMTIPSVGVTVVPQ